MIRYALLAFLILISNSAHSIELALETLNLSKHLNGEEYNEVHKGLFLNVEGFILGAYTNSHGNDSKAIGYHHKLSDEWATTFLLATNYPNTSNGYQAAPFLTWRPKKVPMVQIMMNPALVTFGLRLDLE